LWKQIEGYKALVSQKEEEYHKCEREKIEAERVSMVINVILMKVNVPCTIYFVIVIS
jgi:hypothetical protein